MVQNNQVDRLLDLDPMNTKKIWNYNVGLRGDVLSVTSADTIECYIATIVYSVSALCSYMSLYYLSMYC